ncbi:MAG: PH domain-containing protein [Actinomycetota bacterium]|nr:PH domain-containing protein [Nocardioidaceae bacterium]MDQ3480639.1 PH domain-containing protein [Actinomycetota bacterium]
MADLVTLPHRWRPFGARLAAVAGAVALTLAVTFLWLMLSDEVRAKFTVFQRLSLLGVLAAVLALLNGIFRTSALAEASGLTVTNGYKVRRYEWAEVVRVSLHRNRPWALLDLSDGNTLAVMAIQVSDGQRARLAARELALVMADRSATDDADGAERNE